MDDKAASHGLVQWHGTTIIGVRKDGQVVIAGDGQVSLPLLFKKRDTAPHSQHNSRSTWPSPFASDHNAPVTIPTPARSLGAMSVNVPPSLRSKWLVPGNG